MGVLQTERLNLRELSAEADAVHILELLNEPSFIRFIGDKGARTLDDARRYITNGPIDSYQRHGFGLWLVELRESSAPIGICGLIKRESLPDVDIGFAFLERFCSKGYGFESASAVLRYGRDALGLRRIVAVTNQDNESSIRLLRKLGMRFERLVRLTDDGEELNLFASDA